jgi:RNA polymerase sigma-70 factor (ECF subfamily)
MMETQIDIAQLETHRAALTGHCYRMLGSAFDAEDAVQETLVRAWKNADRFEGRSSVKTWLYRIATNVCLDTLSSESRRARPFEEGPVGTVDDPLETRPRTHWLEPVPDARVTPPDADPYEVTAIRQSIRLAFVAALQYLPPRQRAVLLLMEVLGWSAAETADALDMTVAAANSAIQRGRATLAARNVALADAGELSPEQTALLERYVEAFQAYDVDRLVALLRDDATLSMPPYTLWLQGGPAIKAWLLGRGSGCRGSRLVPTQACGLRAFGQYRLGLDGIHRPWSLTVLELSGNRVARWNAFLDTDRLFPLYGLPAVLDPAEAASGPADAGHYAPNDHGVRPDGRGVRL